MKKQYVIGIDFGTLSGRIVLADAADGTVLAEETVPYAHGVMDETLAGGRKLPPLFALQDPRDYLDVLRGVRRLFERSGYDPLRAAGIGIDFTSCTMLPVGADGEPLSFRAEFADEPHAYVKLWKHHAAQPEADRVTETAAERGELWLSCYGGKCSPEWMLPKILEILHNAPDVYAAAERFTEAADWISFVLTGAEAHAPAFAGYKAFWDPETGYPDDAFLAAVDPRLRGLVGTKLSHDVSAPGTAAGRLNGRGAALTGLPEGTAVALPMIDAHAVMPALGCTEAGDLALILGTSGCQILNASERKAVSGICGVVRDAVVPGLYTYEAGQPAVGDALDWFIRNHIPKEVRAEAEARNADLHTILGKKAACLRPGESGLLALDWLNGNRSVLVNAELTGAMIGMTLATKPEEEYRAWIEASAFGTRMILETFERSGLPVRRVTAAGGIASKNGLFTQIVADVTGREVRIAGTAEAGALGSAMYAAAAAGLYADVAEASRRMAPAPLRTVRPDSGNRAVYDALYAEYRTLHDFFGRGGDRVMERLAAIRNGKRVR